MSRTFVAIENHSRDLQVSNCAKERQLNRAEARKLKDNSENFLKTNGKSAKHSYLTPHLPQEPFNLSASANISEMHYTERGFFN